MNGRARLCDGPFGYYYYPRHTPQVVLHVLHQHFFVYFSLKQSLSIE